MEKPHPYSDEILSKWLPRQRVEWAQAIALRAALRTLPIFANSTESWLRNFALLPFGAVLTSWMQLTDYSIFVRTDRNRANARFGGVSFDFDGYKSELIAALAADASYHSADAQSRSPNVFNDCAAAVSMAANAFHSEPYSHADEGNRPISAEAVFWMSVGDDCAWLERPSNSKDAAGSLAHFPLWQSKQPTNWYREWGILVYQLHQLDPNYSVWIDWYERRIRGERAAFDIPGDKGRIEDKKILRRLAEATNEDFWGKGHEYVNATLKSWLDDARARVAPPPESDIRNVSAVVSGGGYSFATTERVWPTPPQDTGAIAYGVNDQGKLDRLPNSDQVHLRDVPDQRRAYTDLREAAAELLSEGQRLGHRLKRALDRFLHSLPDGFEDAEAYLVWRDANALRRLHRAHREAAKAPEPDEAKLEPVIAEGLGGLLDLYNNFAFADDGLRAKDEARIAPQERASAEVEAKAAIPLVEAILANPEIATPESLDDILADAENAELSGDDPYAGQVLQQSNETRKNFLAAALAWGAKTLSSPKQVGKAVAIGSVTGAAGVVGKVAMTAIIGTDYGPLLPFIAANAEILQRYVTIAFPSFEHLPSLIEQLKALWAKLRH
jgi:hypothetical protein